MFQDCPIRGWFLRFQSGGEALVSLACWSALAVGLVGSLKIVLAEFSIEGDATHSLMLWQGIDSHGISWLKDWRFTQDNWLLSLVPLHFLGFLVFGATASVVILIGWGIYLGSAFAAAAITWRVGARRAAVPVFLLLINLGRFAHLQGFASYSTSHNVTNLFGLVCLFVALGCIDRPGPGRALMLAGALTAGAVSDPWMLAAYSAPILLVGSCLLVARAGHRMAGAILVLSSVVSIAATWSKLFGLLHFVPAMDLPPGSASIVANNLFYLVKNAGDLLNVIPFSPSGSLLASVLSLALALALFLYGLAWLVRTRAAVGPQARLFLWLAVICSGSIGAAFVVRGEYAREDAARFLISLPYLAIVAIGALTDFVWTGAHRGFRPVVATAACLFGVTALASNWYDIFARDFRGRENGLPAAVALLMQQGLSYGYAPYWGAGPHEGRWVEGWGANALTVASGFRIRVRPVMFDRTSGMLSPARRPQTSKAWYTAGDVPADVREYFVVVAPDGEECRELTVCVDGLVRQFGPPARVIRSGPTSILVWNHELVGYERPPIVVKRGVRYTFGNAGRPPNGKGWSTPEAWGTWSEDDLASLRIDVSLMETGNLQMMLEAQAFLPPRNTQAVEVRANGRFVGHIEFDPNRRRGAWLVDIPQDVVRPGSALIDIEFLISTPTSPREAGISDDTRRLGLGIISLEFR